MTIRCVIFVCKRFYLLKYYCWKAKMVKHGNTMCVLVHHVIFSIWMAKVTYPIMVPTDLECIMLCKQFLGITIMLICDQCCRGWHMGCLIPPLEEMPTDKWFCHSPNKPRFVKLDKELASMFFPMVMHIWMGIWNILVRQLIMWFLFAPNLLVFSRYN